jgi:putative SOS response-associated peptidase YedK
MCGRYVSPNEASIEREFNLVHSEWQFPPSFNVAPAQSVPVIRTVEGLHQGLASAGVTAAAAWHQQRVATPSKRVGGGRATFGKR